MNLSINKESKHLLRVLRLGNGDFLDGEGWKQAPEGVPPADLHLQKRFSTPVADGDWVLCLEKHRRPPSLILGSNRKKRILVLGDCLRPGSLSAVLTCHLRRLLLAGF